MRLKNIKLAGFKSFVDPTNVKLTSNMVAVVGPNGCGKSNIIDAVRWVMGESSAKTLRGESMADVIFNGSSARKPVGQASIELIFDNSDGTLGGEYAGFGEIAVKRQVTRDGQSQYFINGAKCRRRDITDIFLGTGLGPRSYAIIEQGMISRLIESKPEELRVFIEEAAGISKYKDRRRETETRIRHTRENLERLTDLREELERQLQRLKRQSEAAAKYKEHKAEEKIVKAQTQSLQWQRLRDQSAGQREQIAQLEVGLEASIAEQRGVDSKIEACREQHTEKTDDFNKVQAEYYGLGAEIARVEQSITHHEERSQQLVLDLQETVGNAEESASHLEEDRSKLTGWLAELAELEPKQNAQAERERQASDVLHKVEASMQGWQHRWDEFNEVAVEPQKNAEVQRSRITQIEEALQGLGSRLERLRNEKKAIDLDGLQQQQGEQEQRCEQCERELETLKQSIERCATQLSADRERQKVASEQLDSARAELQQQKGRLVSLETLQSAADNNTASEWLKSNRLDAEPRLLDQLQVDKGWENAVEVVLGDSLQAVSVSRLDDLVGALSKLDNTRLDFIERGSIDAAAAGGIKGLVLLAEKISAGAPGHLLDGVYAADNVAAAMAARKQLPSGCSIVTCDGIWIGKNWLRVVRPDDSQQGFIRRAAEIDTLTKSITTLEREVESGEAAQQAAADAVLAAEAERERLLEQHSVAERQLAAARAERGGLAAQIEESEKQLARSTDEIKHAEENRIVQQESLEAARVELTEATEKMELIAGQRDELLLERDSVRDELVKAREHARSERDALQEFAVRSESLRAQITSMQATIDRLVTQVEQLEQRKITLEQAQEENATPMKALREGLEEQLQARMKVEALQAAARAELEQVDQTMRELEQSRTAAEENTQSIREQLESLRIDSQSSEVRQKTIEEQLQEEGFMLAQVLAEMPEDAVLEQWQEQLALIGRRIDRLGAINLAAIEEYETESERKKYLDAQNEELESALATLENAIQKIDRETRSLFKQTFDSLNESLQDLFPKVFGGGAAYLEMTGEDLLDTGIAIMARPPGKRNSTIHLLSGGEKALTAIALVFSIFQLNPAPFCMLDEVDAPLDDANTGRYARLVKEMSEKVQFIFITHNKITMEMADHLMGVTMHEPGCSRMVSVDIDEAVQMAAS